MDLVVGGLGFLAAVCWLLAAASGLELVRKHPAPDRSLGWYAWNGIAFFSADSFAPSGVAAHQRMLLGMAGFVLFAGASVLVTVLASPVPA